MRCRASSRSCQSAERSLRMKSRACSPSDSWTPMGSPTLPRGPRARPPRAQPTLRQPAARACPAPCGGATHTYL
eukprot:scaffold104872_cov34-Tisochrysis_lutea.AAC.1